jgi:hypothetical protein
MVILGADTHKRSHTIVAIDEAGREPPVTARRLRGRSSLVIGDLHSKTCGISRADSSRTC